MVEAEKRSSKQNLTLVIDNSLETSRVYKVLPEEGQQVFRSGIINIVNEITNRNCGRWNSIRWEEELLISNTGRINSVTTLRQKLLSFGIRPTSTAVAIKGIIRMTVQMMQAGISSPEELPSVLHKTKTKRGFKEGRSFQSNRVGPPEQQRTTLKPGDWR